MARGKNFVEVDPTILTNIAPLVGPWLQAKAELAELKSSEGMKRHQLLDALFGKCGAGTFHVQFQGATLKMTMRQEATLDYPEWYKLMQTPEYATMNIPANIIKHQDPVLNNDVYKLLNTDQKRFLANVVTVKDLSRTLDWVPEKPADAA